MRAHLFGCNTRTPAFIITGSLRQARIAARKMPGFLTHGTGLAWGEGTHRVVHLPDLTDDVLALDLENLLNVVLLLAHPHDLLEHQVGIPLVRPFFFRSSSKTVCALCCQTLSSPAPRRTRPGPPGGR